MTGTQGGPSFISFEGIDGSGKTTQLASAARWLEGRGRETVQTREPGGAPGAERIRDFVLGERAAGWSAATEALLFTAARRDHWERVIAPALARGACVLSDRFVDSTRVYQGGGDAALGALIDDLHRRAIGREPDLTILLDLPAADAARRLAARAGAGDRFESRGRGFQAELREGFLALARRHPERIHVIEATGTSEQVAERITARLVAAGA